MRYCAKPLFVSVTAILALSVCALGNDSFWRNLPDPVAKAGSLAISKAEVTNHVKAWVEQKFADETLSDAALAQQVQTYCIIILERHILYSSIPEDKRKAYMANNLLPEMIDTAWSHLSGQTVRSHEEVADAVRKDFCIRSWLHEQAAEGISDAELRQVYEEMAADVFFEIEYDLAQVYFEGDRARERAEAALDLLHGSATFADIVKTTSDCDYSKNKGGRIGWIQQHRLPETAVTTLKTLEDGQWTAVIPRNNSFVIYQCLGKRKSAVPFMQVRDKVKEFAVARRTGDVATELRARFLKENELWIWKAKVD